MVAPPHMHIPEKMLSAFIPFYQNGMWQAIGGLTMGHLQVKDREIPFCYMIDRFVGERIHNAHIWEPITTNLFVDLITAEIGDSPFIFLDIGAHWGMYSVVCATFFPNSTIYAFEPMDFNVSFLNANAENFPNIRVQPYGLSDSFEGKQTVWADRSNTCDNRFEMDEEKYTPEFIRTDCMVRKVDSLAIGYGNVGVVKIDAEDYSIRLLDAFYPKLTPGTFIIVEASAEKAKELIKDERFVHFCVNNVSNSEQNLILRKA